MKGRHRDDRSLQIAINTVKAVQNSMKEKRAERTTRARFRKVMVELRLKGYKPVMQF